MTNAFISKKLAGAILLCALCVAPAGLFANTNKKQKKQPPPPLPSGPTGQKLTQVPLDAIKPVPPQVSFQSGQLTIVAANSTLGDILRAVRKQTGAEIEIPEAQDRVVTHLGPGPARDVVAELLNGSRFNYVLVGSPEDAAVLTRVVLVAKSGADNPVPGSVAQNNPVSGRPQPMVNMGQNMAPPPQADVQEANDADAPDENANAEENADAQPAVEEPPAQDQNGPKTPQQMLQEMQQRQMQMQQQLAPGQPPVPGGGFPGRPQQPGQPQQQDQ